MPEQKEALRILSLEASNIKKLTAVQITPQGNVVTLTGANGAGKSSVLDAIWYALAGKEAICEQPIRVGAAKAQTTLKIGDGNGNVAFVAVRKLSATGTSITLQDGKGMPQTSPQTILDRMIGNLTFDPIEFVRMNAKEQLETLRKLVGLDFSAKESERARLYQERTLANRDKERLTAQVAALPFDTTAPKQKVSVEELIGSLSKYDAANREHSEAWQRLTELDHYYQAALDAQVKAEQTLALAKANVAERADALTKQRAAAEALKQHDTEPIKQEINRAGSVNQAVERNAQRTALASQLETTEKTSETLTEKIKAIDKSKADELAAAKFPLPELSFDDNGVLLNKLPFAQASTGEQLRASVAVGMALNPKLRVIFIRDGSVIDDAGLALVAELAKQHDYQVWLETVRSNDPSAVVIEDGHVKEQEPQAELL